MLRARPAYQGLEGIPARLGKGALVEWDNTMLLLDKMPLLRGREGKEL